MPSAPASAASRRSSSADWAALRSKEQSDWTKTQEELMLHYYEDYARPLLIYLMRCGCNSVEAEEQVRAFLSMAVSNQLLGIVQSRQARFRSFLLAAFSIWSSAHDSTFHGEPEPNTADEAYDREWAGAVLGRAMQHVRREYEELGRVPVFEALRGILPGGGGAPSYSRIASDFGMTEACVEQAARDLRVSCCRFLREEVAGTVSAPAMVEDELGYLLQYLRLGVEMEKKMRLA